MTFDELIISVVVALIAIGSFVLSVVMILIARHKNNITVKTVDIKNDTNIVNDIDNLSEKLNQLRKEVDHLHQDNKEDNINANIRIDKIEGNILDIVEDIGFLKGKLKNGH